MLLSFSLWVSLQLPGGLGYGIHIWSSGYVHFCPISGGSAIAFPIVLFPHSARRVKILCLNFFQAGAIYDSLCCLTSRRHRCSSPVGLWRPPHLAWLVGSRSTSYLYASVCVSCGGMHSPLMSLSKEIPTMHILKVGVLSQAPPLSVPGFTHWAYSASALNQWSLLNWFWPHYTQQ